MNVNLTMVAAISYVVCASTHLEATSAHVNRDMNSKRTANSSVKVSNGRYGFAPEWLQLLYYWLRSF